MSRFIWGNENVETGRFGVSGVLDDDDLRVSILDDIQDAIGGDRELARELFTDMKDALDENE